MGALSNTLLKLAIGMAFGRARFRRLVALGLAAVAVVSAASIAWIRWGGRLDFRFFFA